MSRPAIPTIIRITPAACTSIPATVVVTAYFRIAPTAIRNRLVPIVMAPGEIDRRAGATTALGPRPRRPTAGGTHVDAEPTEIEQVEETPDVDGAFPRLSDEQIQVLAAPGRRWRTQAGEVLFAQGDPSYDFIIVAGGSVAIVDGVGEDARLIAVHGPGRFLGEIGLLTGQAAQFTAVVRQPGEVIAVPVDRLLDRCTEDPILGDLILKAYLLRRSMLIGLGTGLRIIGSRFSPDSHRLREFAIRNRLPHRWIDLEEDREAEALLRRLGVAPEETPVVVWRGSEVLRNPSNAELARLLGLRGPSPSRAVCDLVVVGAGPAGLAAAVYGASEGLGTIAVDALSTGGQAGRTSRIENYLGFPAGISGSDLAERATVQARKFGARISVPVAAQSIAQHDGHQVLELDDGTQIAARTVLIATGVSYRKLDVPRLEEFEGTSVYYAATRLEAQLCGGGEVAIVGGGNSAGQAALMLAEHTPKAHLIIRHDDLAEDMSRYLADRIERLANIDVLRRTEVRELVGDRMLEAMVVEDLRTGERRRIDAKALFVFIGADPHTEWLRGAVKLDDCGYVLTGPAAGDGATTTPLTLETSRPGVFAAGDVRHGSTKRMASAVGEGSMAVRLVHEHLAHRGRAAPPAQAHV
jgi:thioredoxin reductase (NADPH)